MFKCPCVVYCLSPHLIPWHIKWMDRAYRHVKTTTSCSKRSMQHFYSVQSVRLIIIIINNNNKQGPKKFPFFPSKFFGEFQMNPTRWYYCTSQSLADYFCDTDRSLAYNFCPSLFHWRQRQWVSLGTITARLVSLRPSAPWTSYCTYCAPDWQKLMNIVHLHYLFDMCLLSHSTTSGF